MSLISLLPPVWGHFSSCLKISSCFSFIMVSVWQPFQVLENVFIMPSAENDSYTSMEFNKSNDSFRPLLLPLRNVSPIYKQFLSSWLSLWGFCLYPAYCGVLQGWVKLCVLLAYSVLKGGTFFLYPFFFYLRFYLDSK